MCTRLRSQAWFFAGARGADCPGLALPVILLGSAGLGDLISGTAEIRPLTALHNPFSGTQVSSISGLLGILALNGAILFLLEFVTEELMFRGYLLGKLLPWAN